MYRVVFPGKTLSFQEKRQCVLLKRHVFVTTCGYERTRGRTHGELFGNMHTSVLFILVYMQENMLTVWVVHAVDKTIQTIRITDQYHTCFGCIDSITF